MWIVFFLSKSTDLKLPKELSGLILQGRYKIHQEYYGTQLAPLLFLGCISTYILIDIITFL